MISAIAGFEHQLATLCFLVSAGLLIAVVIISRD